MVSAAVQLQSDPFWLEVPFAGAVDVERLQVDRGGQRRECAEVGCFACATCVFESESYIVSKALISSFMQHTS
jgi:hypothetical protein